VNISKTKKRYAIKENAILLYPEKPFKQAAIIVYFISSSKAMLKYVFISVGQLLL